MPESLLESLVAVGPLRLLLLLSLAVSAWRAVYLHLRDDDRDPVPWGFMVVLLTATLAMVSLST